MHWTRNKDITNFTKDEILTLIKQEPTLIGYTSTAKQFFETDYEYDLTNRNLIGKPLIDNDIEDWSNVRIIDETDNEIKYLVHPSIYKCTDYSVYVKMKRLVRED